MARKVENSVIVSGKGPIVSVALSAIFSVAIIYNALGRQEMDHPAPIPAFWIEQRIDQSAGRDGGLVTLSTGDRAVPPRPLTSPSASPLLVSDIQTELAAAALYDGSIDGLVGPQTRAAILAYQRNHKLDETGNVSLELLEHLRYTRQIRDALNTSTTNPGAGDYDRELVQVIQQGLAELGYRPGPVDGFLGEQTREAIRRFERDRRMTVTGNPTPALVRELQNISGLSSIPSPTG